MARKLCPKCNYLMGQQADGSYICLSCGHVIPATHKKTLKGGSK